MDHSPFAALLLACGLALAVLAQRRHWRPSPAVTLAVALGFRAVLLIIAAGSGWQPVDFEQGFQPAGEAILDGRDPVLSTNGSWHFLPFVPYFYALGLAVGLPWEIAGRIWTVLADLVLVALVGRLAGPRTAALRRFQYACNPVALMVAVIHAQVEPISLVFLVAAYLVARKAAEETGRRAAGSAVAAGALFGLALSAKSWPIILLPVVLAMLPGWRVRFYGLVAAGAVPLAFLVTLPLVVDTDWEAITNVFGYLGGVRPIVGEWGWTALLTGGDWALVPAYSRIGQIILYTTLGVVAWLWRRADKVDMTTAMLLAFLVVTPRMGAQYLMWFMPFLVARPTRWATGAITAAALWAGSGYLLLTQFDESTWWTMHSWWSRASILVIPWLVLAMPWERRTPAATAPSPAPESSTTPV
ncbi:glycosyltransferase 87 family protein [Spirillospora albida]|uniref:glycosyltransferase 87 family protein n=1 Tax=Spirillospora albida TaxID=58123 RepID=UPI0004C01116|nr:glycosyltransferase 87 family protein [Spirillospora albida]